jgi:hypothetical protein
MTEKYAILPCNNARKVLRIVDIKF